MFLSIQLTLAFNWPSTNHFANGKSHSRTLFHFLNQIRLFASFAQKFSGSSKKSLRNFLIFVPFIVTLIFSLSSYIFDKIESSDNVCFNYYEIIMFLSI